MMTRFEEELRPELLELLLPPARAGAAVDDEVDVDTATSALVVVTWSKVELPLTVRIVVTTCCVSLITDLDRVIVDRSAVVESTGVDSPWLVEGCEDSVPEAAVVEPGVGVGDPDEGCEVTVSVVGAGDADCVATVAEGAADEGVETAAEDGVLDVAAELPAVDVGRAVAELELIPVPRGTLARFCRAISISTSLTATAWYSIVVSRSKRGMAVSPNIVSCIKQKLMKLQVESKSGSQSKVVLVAVTGQRDRAGP